MIAGPYYEQKARELVEANKDRYPDLLIYQLASAMNDAAAATTAAYRMRVLAAVCLRLAERAGVKPQGDEIEAVKLAEEMARLMPSRTGGNGWLEPDQLRIDLADYEERAA